MVTCRTLVELLRERADSTPEDVSVGEAGQNGAIGRCLTYAQLDRQAALIAAVIQDSVEEGGRVLIACRPGLDYVEAFFGCLYAGVIAVPAYPADKERTRARLQGIVEDAGVSLILCSDPRHPENIWTQTGARAITLTELTSRGEPHRLQKPARPDDVAFLQYTSGSTGGPKGVMVSHRNVLENQRMLSAAARHQEGAKGVTWLPPFHDMGLIGNILHAIYCGFPMYLMSPVHFLNSPASWLNFISKHRITCSGGPNTAYDLCVRRIRDDQKGDLDLSSWRIAFNGAEPVRRETMERFYSAFANQGFRRDAFFPCYGLAEATVFVSGGSIGVELARAPGDSAMREPVSCGVPGSGVELRIVDPETRLICAAGQTGEVWLRGPNVTRGYWNNAADTAEVFGAYTSGSRDGPFLRTGDLGFLSGDELFIAGRRKDIIIIGGRNLYPQDLEALLHECDPCGVVRKTACFSIEAPEGERLIALLELGRASILDADLDRIERAARNALAEEENVEVATLLFLRPGGIPQTSSGKTQRGRARELFLADAFGASRIDRTAAPRTASPGADAVMMAIAEVGKLHLENLTPDAPVALSSLQALELCHRLEEICGAPVPIEKILGSVTVSQVLEAIHGAGESDVTPTPNGDPQGPVCTEGQQALFYLQELDRGSRAYNLTRAFRLRGDVDIARFRKSFVDILGEHPILCAAFRPTPSGLIPFQAATPGQLFIDESAVMLTAGEMAEQIDAERNSIFDLRNGPLLRIRLMSSTEGLHLVVAAHHIVLDFRSFEVLLRDSERLYKGLSIQPREATLFEDYAHWVSGHLTASTASREYWRSRLQNRSFLLDLPFDREPLQPRTFEGSSIPFSLSAQAARSVSEFALKLGTTRFTVLVTAIHVLLWNWAGRPDWVGVAVPFHGRAGGRFRDTVGMLVNTLVITGAVRRDSTYQDLVVSARETLAGALAHQTYPFSRMVGEFGRENDLTRPALANVMFSYHESIENEAYAGIGLSDNTSVLPFGDLELAMLSAPSAGAQYELTVTLAKVGDILCGSIEYASALFDESTVRRMPAAIEYILSTLLEQPLAPIGAIRVVPPAEQKRITKGFNPVRERYPERALQEYVYENARLRGQAIAVQAGDRSLTFRELNERSNQIAWGLREHGISREQVVPIIAARSIEMVLAIWAVIKAGGAYLPLDPDTPPDRLRYQIENSGANLILLDSQARRAAVPAGAAMPLALDQTWDEASSKADLPVFQTRGDLAYVMYTSGSTGLPKAVMTELGALLNRLEWMRREFKVDDRDIILQKTRYTFDVSVWEIFLPAMAGAKMVLAAPGREGDPWYLRDLIRKESISLVHFVPSMLAAFLKVEQAVFRAAMWKHAICSGEALSAHLASLFYRGVDGPKLWNLYGPTEAAIDVTWCPVEPSDRTIFIGKPIANTRLYVVNPELHVQPVNVAGELLIGGVAPARGYLNRPDLTAEKFIADPFSDPDSGARVYRTGDVVRWRPDGRLEYLGRNDHQVKIRGFRIELGEIEGALLKHPGIAECVVTAVPSESGSQLCGYCVARGPVVPEPAELRLHLGALLPSYMIPAGFLFLDSLPLTATGKIDRRALPKPGIGASVRSRRRPESKLEIALASIWAAVLGLDRDHIGADDEFIDLGGNSLKAIEIVASIDREFEINLDIVALLRRKTLAELARYVEQVLLLKGAQVRPGTDPAEMETGLI